MAFHKLPFDHGPHAVDVLADHQVLPAFRSLIEVRRPLLVGENTFVFFRSRVYHLPVIYAAWCLRQHAPGLNGVSRKTLRPEYRRRAGATPERGPNKGSYQPRSGKRQEKVQKDPKAAKIKVTENDGELRGSMPVRLGRLALYQVLPYAFR